ncbi:MAG: hypothetical protein HY554_11420 [Elusimicrobia bacterium]|nr:hypothetical protein [Elusimicrobiota bacterium]
MNPFEVRRAGVHRVRVPLKTPFVTALGRKTETENVRLVLTLRGGAEGWGEASSSVVQAHLKAPRIERTLRRLAALALGRDVRRLRQLSREAWRRCGPASAAAAALECALLDAWTQALGIPMSAWFGGAVDHVDTDLTLSAWPAPQAGEAAAAAVRRGFRTLKVKVGSGSPAEDLARVRAASRPRPAPRIVLDGNQGLDRRRALRLVEDCLDSGVKVELLEQPLPREDLDGMRRLTRDCPVPVAADEAARAPAEALEVLRTRAAGAINVKVAKTGLLASLEIAALCRAAGAPLMIGCMQETALGLSPSVHLACGTAAFRWIDLDSDELLAEPRPQGRYIRRGPTVSV